MSNLLERTREALNNYYEGSIEKAAPADKAGIERKRIQAIVNLGLDPYFTPMPDLPPMGIPDTIYGELE